MFRPTIAAFVFGTLISACAAADPPRTAAQPRPTPRAQTPAPSPTDVMGQHRPTVESTPPRSTAGIRSWKERHPVSAQELGEWMAKHPEAAEQLVQWARESPDEVETLVMWGVGHRYEDVGAFLLSHPRFETLHRIWSSDPEAVSELMEWSRRSVSASEEIAKRPGALVWLAENVYGVRHGRPRAIAETDLQNERR